MSKSELKMVIGMDMSDAKSEICVMDYNNGNVLQQGQVANTVDGLIDGFSFIEDPSKVLIAMEAGTHSPWISHTLSDMGFNVVVGNARKMKYIWASDNKSDTKDAEMLARIARFDRKLFYPIKHRSKESQAVLASLKARDALIKTRTSLINSVRGLLKSLGYKAPSCSSASFAKKLLKEMPEIYCAAIKGTLEIIGQISREISKYDKQVESLCKTRYKETEILRQVKGVGPLTSLAFVLVVEDPTRFEKSRNIGAYLGLVPKRDQSGTVDKQLGITKAGNGFMRKLLVQCAQYIMGEFGEDCELRRFGERVLARGGKAAKKRAVTAVARKLAVLLHRLWIDEAEYDPFYTTKKREKKNKNIA